MRPQLWPVALAAALAIYGTPKRLNGQFLYDDKAAVLRNPVVIGAVPLSKVWEVDFWGEHDLRSAESHKSWRPLVTLSYRANYLVGGVDPFGYHCVNALVHAAVSALLEPATHAAFGWRRQLGGTHGMPWFVPGVAAVLFAVHPVHVEAAQNIVGRAELMMSLFYLCGLLAYTHLTAARREFLAVTLALACSLAATLCKETGFTLPALCASWDLLVFCAMPPTIVVHWVIYYCVALPLLRPGVLAKPTLPPAATWRLLVRLGGLAIGGAGLCAWRLVLNGGTLPRFNGFENPAALHPHPVFRALSVAWVWVEYCWAVWWPSAELSCDWSYPALPPIQTLHDPRVPTLIAFCCTWLAIFVWACAPSAPRPRVLMCIGFGVLPFLLASNLVTTVGTSKAERLLYLPSAGGCMAAALAAGRIAGGDDHRNGEEMGEAEEEEKEQRERRPGSRSSSSPSPPARVVVALCASALGVASLAHRCAAYADVWCDGVLLWGHAVRVQGSRPEWLRGGVTTHALAEFGMQLSWAGRNEEAAGVLERQVALCESDMESNVWPMAGRLQVTGYSALSIVYRMLGREEQAVAIADRGLRVIQRAATAAGPDGQADAKMASREGARCLAARALALYARQPDEAVAQIRQAVHMAAGDAVVLALAKQLDDHLQRVMAM
jgi:hypothetical protein